MFYYKTSFSKKAVFLKKMAEKPHLWEDLTVLREEGASDDKNQYNPFCRHRCFEYF